MKKAFALALALLLACIALWAVAENQPGLAYSFAYSHVKKVDFDRITLLKPHALKARLRNDGPGRITIVVDTLGTDWNAVARDPMGCSVRLQFDAPQSGFAQSSSKPFGSGMTQIDGGYLFGGIGKGDMEWMLAIIQGELGGSYTDTTTLSNGETIGTLDVTSMVFIPESYPHQSGETLCWLDKSNDLWLEDSARGSAMRYYEDVSIAVEHNTDAPVPMTALDFITPAMLSPMVDDPPFGADAQAKNGHLTLAMPEHPQGVGEGQRWVDVPLVLKAPGGAVSAVLIGPYGAYGKDVLEDGTVTFTDEMAFNLAGMAEEYSYTLLWLDEDGRELRHGLLTVHILPYQRDFFPTYVQDWQAVPKERIHVFNNAGNLGVVAQKQDGQVHITRRRIEPRGSHGTVRAQVSAPDGYTSFVCVSAGGSIIVGQGKEGMVLDQIGYLPQAMLINGGTGDLFASEPLTRFKAGPMDVYLQTENIFPHGGGVWVIRWFGDGKEPLTEYLCQTVDPMYQMEIPVDVVNSENQMMSRVLTPTAVRPKGADWDGWQLTTRIDPQSETMAKHYELCLVNATGSVRSVEMPTDDPLVLYMPYPQGKGVDSTDVFTLHHFSRTYQQLEELIGEKTEYGIRYEVCSLSPFVLSWGEQETEDAQNALHLPESLETVEAGAFAGGAFEAVYASENLKAIESAAFAGCAYLRDVYVESADVQISAEAFTGCPETLTLWAPEGSTAEAFAAENGLYFVATH